jgi:hypothetical protein
VAVKIDALVSNKLAASAPKISTMTSVIPLFLSKYSYRMILEFNFMPFSVTMALRRYQGLLLPFHISETRLSSLPLNTATNGAWSSVVLVVKGAVAQFYVLSNDSVVWVKEQELQQPNHLLLWQQQPPVVPVMAP